MAPPLARDRLLHLDADVCVIDKPSGVLSLPSPGREREACAVLRSKALLEGLGEDGTLFAVHRLDEETSGTLVLARNEAAREALDAVFRRHGAERIYHAVVLGRPRAERGRLVDRLAVDEQGIVRVVERGGQEAITDYAVVAYGEGWCVVACRLETGRRNQIRVQFAAAGFPIVGDRKYGRKHGGFKRQAAKRTLLHASGISLEGPSGPLRVTAALAADMRDFVGPETAARIQLG